LITVFSTPKAFEGIFDHIQHNAIASWRRLGDDVQVILFGDDPGCAEAAAEHGAEHVPDVVLSPQGTPMLDDMFRRAQRTARHDVVMYVNADIMLLPDVLDCASVCLRSDWDNWLMVGRRTNLDVDERLDDPDGSGELSDDDWVATLRELARTRGELFTPYGIDYFAFPRGGVDDLLPFPVGRAMWDNWLIFNTRRKRVPVIDATHDNLVLHQNHDYSHIEGGMKTAWSGPEAQRNLELVGPDFVPFSVRDATWELRDGALRRVRAPRRLLRHALTLPALLPGLSRGVRVARALKSGLARLRPSKRP